MEGHKESPEYSVYAVKNTRRLMEDRHVVIPDLLSQFKDKDKGDKHYSYYAVFDGHAGPDAAQFAADNLHKNLVESSFFQSGNFIDAFRHAYALTDFQYTEKSERDGIKSGCTAVTCLLENKKKLYMAWVGDSVALLSRNGKPCFLMEPHNLERDDEKERVESMGGAVIYFDTWRVNGTLSVSRAIGDPEYKPYVCSDPDIEQIDLDGTEDFLIIGCDGLWDRMSPEDAIGIIYQHIQTNCHLEPSEIVKDTAKILGERAIADGSNDNVTTIVIFLRDVASIINTSSFVPLESSNNVFGAKMNGDNLNTYDLPTGLNNIVTSNNNNNYGNGLIDTSDFDSRPTNNGSINEEVIGDTIGASEDKDIVSQLEGKNSTLNPFADEFQPNITSNSIIENQFGIEPKKDDEELNKNDGLERKDLWMSEFKNDGNNEQHQQDYSNQAEMLDGLVVNGLSASENLSGNDVDQPNYSSRIEENFLSSEVVQQNPHDFAQEPSAPEMNSIDKEQFATMEANMSQAEIFVGNLTPTEVPSSPVANSQVTGFPAELSSQLVEDQSSQCSFETSQSNPDSNVNQYITSVSDAMVSEPYHDSYFASDSVEPESIIVNTCDDAISSGPHAIDPYSGDDKELESDSNKELAGVPLNQPLAEEEVAIEVTDNATLGSSNPFGSSILNESQAHLAEELEAKMPTEEEKSFFTESNSVADVSSALLDFSADQVNEIVLSPYPANESSIIETKFNESVEEPITEQELISQQEISPPEKSEDLSVITEKTSVLNINNESEANVPLVAPITESNQTENITELICGSTEEKSSEAIVETKTEASKDEETIGVTTTTAAAVAAVATAAAVSGAAIASKSSQPSIKESTTQAKSNITKKPTAPLSKTTSRTTASSVKLPTATTARKPLSTTSTTKTAPSRPGVGLASSKLTSKPATTSTSTVKSTTTSRVGTTSTLNKKPTQTSTTTSGISRISSLSSRTSSSTVPSSSSATTTGKPLTRTTTTTTASSAASRRPLSSTTTSGTAKTTSTTSKPTLSTRTTTSSSRTVTSSTTRTGVKETDKKETSTGLTKPNTKRASTGSMLNRPSPGASSLTNKVNTSALNRSMTSSSRPGATTNSTVSKLSTRPSSSTMSSTRSPGLSSTRSLGAKTSATTTTKSTTSTNKVAVSRLGANKKPTASTTSSKEATSVTNSSSINSTGEVINCNEQKTSSSSPVDATTNLVGTSSSAITNSIKRDKNMMPNSNSLKDELEAALASPISCEDKGVIKGTKDNESSENL